MKDTHLEAPLVVTRTSSQKVGFLVVAGIAMVMALAITIAFPLMIPQLLTIPQTAGDLILPILYLSAGPLILALGAPGFFRAMVLPANAPIMEVSPMGLVVHADVKARRFKDPIDLAWSQIRSIHTSSGGNGAREFAVTTHEGEVIKLMPQMTTPGRAKVVEAMLDGAKRAGYDTRRSRQFQVIASRTTWNLRPAGR
ncbi:MAG: hypothetical protein AAFQ79_11820 [Pseudomonadota bacterium]